ncbi:MAG: hypothetical protein RLZZ524_3194 [Pseudomonadota bacterium]|jgi:fermentation-respiration switch protein FrsA (DUF1100 family)
MSLSIAMLCVMAIDIPTSEPAKVRAGDTVTWRKTLADYPATAGWTLYYRLLNSLGKIDITATADGSDHLVAVDKTTTAGWRYGDFSLLSWVASSTERVSLPQRRIVVLQDFAALTNAGADLRSQAKQMLDAIDAALLSLSTGERLAVVEAEVAGRRLKYNLTGLMQLRNLYAAQVRSEEAAERASLGLAPKNKIVVRL